MRIERVSAWLAVVGASALCSGCPGTLEDKQSFIAYAAAQPDPVASAGAPADPPDTAAAGAPAAVDPNGCGDVVARIFAPTCGGTGCHSATGSQQGLDLVSPGVASRLVGASGTTCLQPLVDPAQPENSLLYLKLLPKPPCGAQMPLARPPLGSADVACVLAWIAAQ